MSTTSVAARRRDAGLAAEFVQICKAPASISISSRGRCPSSTSTWPASRAGRRRQQAERPIAAYRRRSDSPRDRRPLVRARRQSGARRRRIPGRSRRGRDAAARDKGRAQFGDVKIETTKQYCEWVCRHAAAVARWHAARHLRIDGRASHLDDAGCEAGGRRSSRSRRRAVQTAKLQVGRVARLHAGQPRSDRAHPRQDAQCRPIRQRRRRTERRGSSPPRRRCGASTSAK